MEIGKLILMWSKIAISRISVYLKQQQQQNEITEPRLFYRAS